MAIEIEIKTNYDRIKAMSVDEMADVFYSGIDKICFDNCTKSTGNKFECPIKDDVTPDSCKECIKRWLESEVDT